MAGLFPGGRADTRWPGGTRRSIWPGTARNTSPLVPSTRRNLRSAKSELMLWWLDTDNLGKPIVFLVGEKLSSSPNIPWQNATKFSGLNPIQLPPSQRAYRELCHAVCVKKMVTPFGLLKSPGHKRQIGPAVIEFLSEQQEKKRNKHT